jgi:mannose-6-phosphate isomerase
MTASALAPLVLAPKVTAAIWGGDALVRHYGKPGDPAALLGESWECWDRNEVTSGPDAGDTLAELRARRGRALTGPADPAQIFPVLTKIIDARAPLSVQVHPGDAYAQRVEHQPFGKTECWLILAAEPGAELVLGWTRDTDRAEVERRTADGTLGDLLRRVPVAPGDAFYLPAGTVHAIGAGIQLFETQQASDLTYRLFDWNRMGADGKPRELHVAKSLDVLDYRATFPGAVRQLTWNEAGAERTLAIADAHFAVERVRAGAAGAEFATGGRPVAVLATDRGATIATAGGPVALRAWETALIPAAAEAFSLTGAGEALLALVAPDLGRLRERALANGIGAAAFDAFRAQFSGASGPA